MSDNKKECGCHNSIHISEVKGIKPESVAFISYILDSIPYNALHGAELNVPFLKVSIGFGMWFKATTHDGKEMTMEVLIVYKDSEAAACIQRVFEDGVLNEDSIGFYQLMMRPYDQSVVIQAIKDLPMLTADLHS